MKQYKRATLPVKSPKTQPQPTHKNPASTPAKQEIDAALQKLSQLIEKDPGKAAKIFEAWLDSSGQSKKNVQKKSAA